MNPYSIKLNFFSSYQYCRSLGLQLISFDTKKKADAVIQYLKHAGFAKYNFWTSGNNLASDTFIWMSTGLPFNPSFNYVPELTRNTSVDTLTKTELPQFEERIKLKSYGKCIAICSPSLKWKIFDCTDVMDFICEQTRYEYKYGSVPIFQSKRNYNAQSISSVITTPTVQTSTLLDRLKQSSTITKNSNKKSDSNNFNQTLLSNIIVQNFLKDFNLIDKTSLQKYIEKLHNESDLSLELQKILNLKNSGQLTYFTTMATVKTENSIRKSNLSVNLESQTLRSIIRSLNIFKKDTSQSNCNQDMETTSNTQIDSHTVGPYESNSEDYQADTDVQTMIQKHQYQTQKDIDDDTSTILPAAEPSYRYNIKIRSNGKVLDPSSE